MPMLRLFVALHFPETILQSLRELITDLKAQSPEVGWVRPESIHLTLKFLGDTLQESIPAIIGGLELALMDAKACEISVRGCGGFPNLRKPRVLWAGIEHASPISSMAEVINLELARLGIEKDTKRFSPHVTLGRIKKPGEYSRLGKYMENLNFFTESVILRQVALVRSTLTSGGPIYENVKTFELEKQ